MLLDMEFISLESLKALAPHLLGLIIASFVITALVHLPGWIRTLRIWRKYCASHSKFSLEAGAGKYKWLEDPWSKSRNFWLCKHSAIKHVFSRAAISETDHRAGFDWFHFAGWKIPTMDPRYKDTVRTADQTVHAKLAKAKLAPLLETVKSIGYSEIQRIKTAVGPEGRVVSLHTVMYRLGYNINCIGIFGPDLDHVGTRIILQEFTENMHMLFCSFNWPLPIWLSTRIAPRARKAAKARRGLYDILLRWYETGGMATASPEMRAVVKVFEEAKTSADISSKFMNMMMIAFLANTPEAIGWLFAHIIQAPELLKAIRAECDALGSEYTLANVNFKQATPHLYSALFETFRLHVFTGTPATVIKHCTLPGMGEHVFQPGDIVHSMGESCAMDVEIYGEDAKFWKGHRFLDDGENLLKYDLTFGLGRSPCPGRNFAIAELCMHAARMVQVFDFSEPSITEHLRFDDGDWKVGRGVPAQTAEIIDLDGKVKTILHPGNASDSGPPGMTASNIALHDFACKLTPRSGA